MKKSNKKDDIYIPEFEEDDFDNIVSEFPSIRELKSHINVYQTDLILYYYDMSYVASIADNSFALSTPYKSYSSGVPFSEKQKKQYEDDVIFVKENNKKAIRTCKKLEKHAKLKSTIFNQIRQIYPDFCLKIEDKIDPDQFTLYKNTRRNFRVSLCYNCSYSSKIPSVENLNRIKDKLSQVIDSKDFLDVCIIEDNFVLAELETFSNLLANLPPEEKKSFLSQKIYLSDSKHVSMQELLEKFKSETLSKLSRHLETLKLYDKIYSAKEIRLDIKAEDHGDDSCDR